MTVQLHPKVADLVNEEALRATQVLRRVRTKEDAKVRPDDVVNEILWLALRTGDISKHYTEEEK